MSLDPQADLALARAAAAEAAELAVRLGASGVEHWLKAPGNPVTSADLALDALLRARLSEPRPDYGWLSEETADEPSRLARRAVWVVDPIDGTRDFLRGRPGWAVSVALAVDGVILLGALAAPALGQTFWALAGGGAHLNGERLAVSNRGASTPPRLPVEPHVLASPLWGEGFAAQSVAMPNSLALRMALVAAGEAEAMVDGRASHEWDVAAASLLVTEAGGLVSTRDGGPLAFNKPLPDVAGLVCAAPGHHGPMQARLQQLLDALATRRQGVRPPKHVQNDR